MKDDRERFLRGRLRRLSGEADQRARVPASRWPRCWPAPERRHGDDRRRQRSSSSTTSPQNVRLLEAVLAPRGYRGRPGDLGRRGARARRGRADRPRAARHRHAGDGRLRGLPARCAPTRRRSFLPVVMITASGDQEKVAAIEAGRRRLHRQAVRPGRAARARRARCCGSSATTTRSRRRPPSWRRGTASSSSASSEQVDELERVGPAAALPARRSSPSSSSSSGDESFLESHRREITVVFCDLRGFTAFAETVEPEDLMAVLGEYHAALGDLVHRFEGTLERFTGDGLMVFFNDPLPCPDAPERAVRMARRDARPRRRAGRGLAPAGPRPRLRRRHRAGPRHARPRSASRAAPTTRRSAASRTSRRGCAREAAPGQILISQRVLRGGRGDRGGRAGRRARAARVLAPDAGLQRASGSTRPGPSA